MTYPLLLSEIRKALGEVRPGKLLPAAIPGRSEDMTAFKKELIPNITKSIDFFNVMTYDLMNRRDNVTKHHTSKTLSLDTINAYLDAGIPPEKLKLGFELYAKFFKTQHESCDGKSKSLGCPTVELENPVTGVDTNQSSVVPFFGWPEGVPPPVNFPNITTNFEKAMNNTVQDPEAGAAYYWDSDENLWWTYDTPEFIKFKFFDIVEKKKLGGDFV